VQDLAEIKRIAAEIHVEGERYATTFAVGLTNDLSFAVSIPAGRAGGLAADLHIDLAGADVENLLLNCPSGIALAQKMAVLIPVGGEFLLTQRLSARKTRSNGSGTVDF
jgi:hypothetical protein